MSQRIRIEFRKDERARFLSHLDLLATLEYAIRRAHLPVEISAGFTPRPRMSVAAALPLGHLGDREILEIDLRAPVDLDDLSAQLQAALPPGLTLVTVSAVPPGIKSAAALVESGVYRVRLEQPVSDLPERVAALLARESIEVMEERMEGIRTRDVRPLILWLKPAEANSAFELEVRLDGNGTVRPEQVLDLMDLPREGTSIRRRRLTLRG